MPPALAPNSNYTLVESHRIVAAATCPFLCCRCAQSLLCLRRRRRSPRFLPTRRSAFGPHRRTGIPLFVPEGAIEHFRAFIRADDAGHDFMNVFDHRTVGNADADAVGEVTVRFAVTEHSVPCLAVRAEADGRSMTYSGDTGPGGGFEALANGTSLMLSEASYQGERDPDVYPHHLTAGEAGAMARRAAADRLMLTHIQPALDPQVSLDEAEKAFGRTVELAVPGMEITI
ncbi:MAG: MBL fold metallo-hydrolase [Acidimicrobiia bacterium]|nr:MBL fold metallo-hydrolase [Acidimicrobiia bacterium]